MAAVPDRANTPDHNVLAISGALLVGGFVVNAIQRMLLHPTGAEDEHEAIFTPSSPSTLDPVARRA